MKDCKPVEIPISKETNLSKSDYLGESQQKLNMPYAQVVGSLMSLMLCTQPNINFQIGLVSKYQNNPAWSYCQTIKHIFIYLKGLKGLSLTYQAEKLDLKGYSYANFIRCKDDSKSTSGYVFIFGRSACKKQEYIVQRTQNA